MKCSLCGLDVAKDNLFVRPWSVKQVTDHRAKQFGTSGFPSSCTVTVQGWRVKELCTFDTGICAECVKKDKMPKVMKAAGVQVICKKIAMVSGAIALLILLLVVGLWIAGFGVDTHKTLMITLYVLGGVSILGTIVSMAIRGESQHTMDQSDEAFADKMHLKIVRNEFAKTPEGMARLSMAPPSARAGDTFLMDARVHFDDRITDPNWSLVTATWQADATASRTDPQPYDAKLLQQSVSNMGFSTVGEYLESEK
jgi:hypothetical protein